jgi:hypothetical protein
MDATVSGLVGTVWKKFSEMIKSADIFFEGSRFSSLPRTNQLRYTLVNLLGYNVFHFKFHNNKDAAISGLLLEKSIISQLLKEFVDTKAQHEYMNTLQGLFFRTQEILLCSY